MSIILAIFINFLLIADAWCQPYSIEDLRALERSGDYEEFLKHAKDIRPSQRDKHWRAMLSHMATSYIQNVNNKKKFDGATFQFIEDLYNWPSLKKDKLFAQLRNDYGLSYLANCFASSSNSQPCTSHASAYWNNSRDKVRSGAGLGEILIKYRITGFNQWELFQASIKSPFGQYYCSKDHVTGIVLEKLSLDIDFEYSTLLTLKKLNNIVHPSCLKELIPILRTSLKSSNLVTSTMAFQVLRAKDLLSVPEKDFFLTKYMLETHSPGPLYNMAWNHVNELSQDFTRRHKVAGQLKQLDPLPGQVFSIADLKKRKVLAKFLSAKLPEYFDYYAQTCLDYYEGTRDFPYGIPTPHCDDFFSVVKENSLRTQELHLRYSALKK